MHVRAQLLQPLLVGDAEMLLLVDDQQAEILELDALGQQRVRAADDVDGPVLEPFLGRLGFLGRHQARQAADVERHALEALDEGAVMLAGQQGRRPDHRHLLARHGGDEGGPQRHLGLAEAHVAADQPVHRLAGGKIVHDVGDRLQLVIGLGIGEARAEFLVQALGRTERLASPDRALGGDLDQAVGHVGNALLQLGLARLPGDAAQPVEDGPLLARAVTAQHVDVLDRHEELVATVVGEPQAVVAGVMDLERHETLVAPDAMLAMHHEVAVAERRCFGNEPLRRATLLGRSRQAVAKDVLLADDLQPIEDEAMLQRPDDDGHDAGWQCLHHGEVGGEHRRGGAVLLQEVLQARGRAVGVARDDDAATGGGGRLHMLGHLVEQVHALRRARLRETLVTAAAEVDRVHGAKRRIEGRELRDGATVEQPFPFRRLQIEPFRRDGLVVCTPGHAPLGTGLLAGIVIVGNQLVSRVEGFSGLMVGRDDRTGTIVEERFHVIVEQRQPVLDTDETLAGRDRFVEQILARDVAEQLAIAAAETLDALRGQQYFADRQQHDLVARAGRTLAHRIERSDRLERVAKQVEAQRLLGARRKEIEQAAAHGELARLHHRLGPAVAVLAQEFGQPVDIDRLAFAQDRRRLGVKAFGRHALQGGAHRGEDDPRRRTGRLGRRQPAQRLQSLGHDVGMGRHAVVGQAVPCREDQHFALGAEEAQAVLQPLQPLTVARHVQDVRTASRPRQLHQHEGVGSFGQPGDCPSDGLAGNCCERTGKRQSH